MFLKFKREIFMNNLLTKEDLERVNGGNIYITILDHAGMDVYQHVFEVTGGSLVDNGPGSGGKPGPGTR